MSKRKEDKIEDTAFKISQLVLKTDTNDRGNLYERVADKLRFKTQFYTANLFSEMAERYKKGE